MSYEPDTTELRIERAHTLLEIDRPQDAEREARLALAGEPQNTDALVVLALALDELKRPKEAVEAGKSAVASDPESPMAHAALAAALIGNGLAVWALDEIDEALAIAFWVPDFHVIRAGCLLELDRPEEALEAVNDALEIAPENPAAMRALSAVYVAVGRNDEAAEAAAEAIALRPDDAAAHSLAATAALLSGDTTEALNRYREAVRLEPLDADHRAALSVGLRAQNPFYAALLRFSEWQERQGPTVRKFGLFGPAILVGLIRVTGLADTNFGLVLVILLGALLALSWAIEPVTNALFLTGKEGRLLLDPREARSAKLFALTLAAGVVIAVLALFAAAPAAAVLSAIGLGILALGLGASHQVEAAPLLGLFYIGSAVVAACAVAATACSLAGVDGVVFAIPVLLGGIGSLWLVRLGK